MLLVHTLYFEYQGSRHLVSAEEHQEGNDVVREIWYRTPPHKSGVVRYWTLKKIARDSLILSRENQSRYGGWYEGYTEDRVRHLTGGKGVLLISSTISLEIQGGDVE